MFDDNNNVEKVLQEKNNYYKDNLNTINDINKNLF
jgi:hypothetical protein